MLDAVEQVLGAVAAQSQGEGVALAVEAVDGAWTTRPRHAIGRARQALGDRVAEEDELGVGVRDSQLPQPVELTPPGATAPAGGVAAVLGGGHRTRRGIAPPSRDLQQPAQERVYRVQAVRVVPDTRLAPDLDRSAQLPVARCEGLAVLRRRHDLVGAAEHDEERHAGLRHGLEAVEGHAVVGGGLLLGQAMNAEALLPVRVRALAAVPPRPGAEVTDRIVQVDGLHPLGVARGPVEDGQPAAAHALEGHAP